MCMKAPQFLCALLAASALNLSAQVLPDNPVVLQGVVRAAHQGPFHWGLFLPAPLVLDGLRTNWVRIDPEAQGVGDYADRFVEATGTLHIEMDSGAVANATLVGCRMKERYPDGTVRQNVQLSYTQRSVVTLAIAPMKFMWRDSIGDSTSARPLVLFELANQGDTPLHLGFPRSEVLCVRVRSLMPGVIADTSWAVVQPGVRQASIVMGQRYRMIFELPRGAAPLRGRYRLRAELCTASPYGAETTFEISR